ncbi:MAG: nucleotide sugar dehydrogenase [Candidatus Thorarchaeota archaeon]
MTKQNLVVVGLGYVGLPVAAKFAEAGFNVTGIDIVHEKVDRVNSGESTIEGDEPHLADLVKKVVGEKSLTATTEYAPIKDADFVLIVVETPFSSRLNKPYYTALRAATTSVGRNLRKGTVVIVESTVAPGTIGNIVQPLLEAESGLEAGKDFLLAVAPERVMPGKLLYNLVNMDRVIGGIDDRSTDAAVSLYEKIVEGELFKCDALTAEVVKTTENAYRDVQIAFANELALLCEKMGVDVFEVRNLVNKAPFRNMHLPGAGVGGHCLPKDSWLLAFGAKGRYEPRLIAVAREINDGMPLHMSDLCEGAIQKHRGRLHGSKVTILGIAYLENSDDTRNSPAIPLKESLEVVGIETSLHDPKVRSSEMLPILRDLYAAARDSDCIAIVTAHNEYRSLDLDRLKTVMRTPIIIDGRNILDSAACEEKGFHYWSVGRPHPE